MRVPISWLREYADLPAGATTEDIAGKLTAIGLKLEEIISSGISGPLVVGRVLSAEAETHKNGKTVQWCRVDVGPDHNNAAAGDIPASRGIVCGADNFSQGDLVVVSLPGAVLPGGFHITARTTYGHVSDGMMCSQAELGLGVDHAGIIVLEPRTAVPGDDAIALLSLDEETIELEVNPDRGYALSIRGVARDAAMAFGVEFHDPADIAVPEIDGDGYPVDVHDTAACPVFAAVTVTGIDQTRSTPAWMVRRIERSGMRAISLAVDITNYVMLELGQPIHGYDRHKLRGAIVVRRAECGEQLTTLDGVCRECTGDDLLICDDRGPIGMAGVMGGQDVEMTPETTDIVIEAAHFHAPGIARTARIHKLPSEASKRFERGVDPALPLRAATRVAQLLATYGGAQVEPGVTVRGHSHEPATVRLAPELPGKITGVALDTRTVVEALRANGCTVDDDGPSDDPAAAQLVVTVPSWRPDLTDPYDLIEEVLRVVGYDSVPSVLPVAPAGRGLTPAQKMRRRAGLILAGAGLTEVTNFPFAGASDFDALEIDDRRRRQVLLENPLSAERPGMTTTLLAGLLSTLALNIGRGHENVEIFEIGRVFLPRPDEDGSAPIYRVDQPPDPAEFAAFDDVLPCQPVHLAMAMAGERDLSGWWGRGRAACWADPLQMVRRVAKALHVPIRVQAAEFQPFHPGRCAAVYCDTELIGHAGELHPRVVSNFGLPQRAVAAEVDLNALIAAAPALGPKPGFSTFPVAKEDLALVVEDSVPAEEVRRALAGAHELIESVRLFDVYTGDQVGHGMKSLAFSLRLRAFGHTLSEEEMRVARESAVSVVYNATGATLRTH